MRATIIRTVVAALLGVGLYVGAGDFGAQLGRQVGRQVSTPAAGAVTPHGHHCPRWIMWCKHCGGWGCGPGW